MQCKYAVIEEKNGVRTVESYWHNLASCREQVAERRSLHASRHKAVRVFAVSLERRDLPIADLPELEEHDVIAERAQLMRSDWLASRVITVG